MNTYITNSGWNGGTYELNIDMEQEYNIEYGESYSGFNMYVDYESIKKFVEIAFSRWIKKRTAICNIRLR